MSKYCCICGREVPNTSEFQTGFNGKHEGFACKKHSSEEVLLYTTGITRLHCSECGNVIADENNCPFCDLDIQHPILYCIMDQEEWHSSHVSRIFLSSDDAEKFIDEEYGEENLDYKVIIWLYDAKKKCYPHPKCNI